jgi:peptidoglycan/xylan/chitin deacetylase (PgdA/CDA1 family)
MIPKNRLVLGVAVLCGLWLASCCARSPASLALHPPARVGRPVGPGDGRPLLVTVDDLPLVGGVHRPAGERARVTEGMLAVLARHGVRAVGMVTWARAHGPDDAHLLERWLEAGHELGNHSHDHPSYTARSAQAFLADAERGRERLARVLGPRGQRVRFFRFPFLREGDTQEKLAAGRTYLEGSGQRNLPVTLDTQDWSFEQPWVRARRRGDDAALGRVAEAYQRSLRADIEWQERLGDELFGRPVPQILLLHASEVSASQWDVLFRWLRGRGYRFATADEVLGDAAFADLPRWVGDHGPGLWSRIADVRRRERSMGEIRALFDAQARAWTEGRLEDFCSYYDEHASFLTPSGVTVGRDRVLARYRSKYGGDKRTMGELGLEILEIVTLAGTEVSITGGAVPGRPHGMSVTARWRLRWADQPEKSGLTLIVLRRTAAGWRIVHDASM